MNICTSPLIGVILVNPESQIEVSYYAVSSANFPAVQSVLDALVLVLGYWGIRIEDGPVNHTYESRCKDPTTPASSGGDDG